MNKGSIITDLVHQHMIKQDQAEAIRRKEEKQKENPDEIKFYPSSLGHCIRKNVYQMLGYIGKPHDGQTLLIFENGNSFHTRMENLFKEMDILIAPELSLKSPEIYVSGRSDAIIKNINEFEPSGEVVKLVDPDNKVVYEGDPNAVMIVELKSIKGKNFDELPIKAPKPDHMRQLQLYFYQTDLKYGYVYYESKDNQRTKAYYVERDEGIIQGVIDEIMETVDYVKRKELPERPFVATDIPCRFCNFRDLCHPESQAFSYEDLFKPTALPF